MTRPPPPPGPPSGSKPQPPKARPPPPPPARVAAPPPPPHRAAPPPPPPNVASLPSAPLKRKDPPAPPPPPAKKQHTEAKLSIQAPAVMRDVDVFEKKHKVGEGTYGSVFVARDKKSNEIVALKRINTKQEENGFPITALREVKILKALHHANIVNLKEIVTSKEQGELPKDVFMVFEYMEYDLTGILETLEIKLTQDHVKSWSQQLLSGCHYMHTNKVIHRDLKASNLLINRKGELKIADWGLARSWNSEMKRLTNKVITLWYRPPELLLGCVEYTTKIDMWSVGCIIAEMFRRSGFLKGSTEATQLDLIFRTCGHPTEENWPGIQKQCSLWTKFKPSPTDKVLPNRLAEALRSNLPHPKWMTDEAVKLISKLMEMNPDRRWSALEALDAEYFFENPIFKPAKDLMMNFAVNSVHEMDCRKKYEQKMAQHKAQMQAMVANGNGPRNPPN
eukprot:CAMPEP_0170207130 /NCGR_PEP_ID=MMETSP0116_2-20130129/3139_1 /TAXON_ID=400756 /ORGANISM="Durinskia baltica, Strain CSIRO CS-38" /LENGTH=449 /DNA_ID=CAMNT_0010457581 /DNA_START=416 /DNA_END=1765 /DNA_ORIENTATION=+